MDYWEEQRRPKEPIFFRLQYDTHEAVITVRSRFEAEQYFLQHSNANIRAMVFKIKPNLSTKGEIVTIFREQPIIYIERNKEHIKEGENKMNDLVKQHKEYCDKLNRVYAQKNKKYGDSFGISVRSYGNIAALTRISDKFHRMEQLILSCSDGSDTDERLEDTLLDMANYCIMTAMEIENAKKNICTEVNDYE